MRSERDRRVEHDLARLREQARGRGAVIDPRELERIRAELARRHRAFPLIPVLACALALACCAGVWLGVARPGRRTLRGETGDGETADDGEAAVPTDAARSPPDGRGLALLGAVTAASLGLVAVLRLFE